MTSHEAQPLCLLNPGTTCPEQCPLHDTAVEYTSAFQAIATLTEGLGSNPLIPKNADPIMRMDQAALLARALAPSIDALECFQIKTGALRFPSFG